MHTATVKLTGMTPISFSRYHNTEKIKTESADDYEKRTWREKLHVDKNDNVYIPLMSLKNCLSECAKYISMPVKGKARATYTKHFEAGVLVSEHINLGIKKNDVNADWQFVPSDGKRGGSKRVPKCFPTISEWAGTTTVTILDDVITKDVFEQHLKEAGRFIGLGRFRPRNNGYYGRFEAEIIDWK